MTGQQAEAYADGFIAVHIANMTGGQTYAQLSGKALAQPNNTKLQGQVATVFKGETLRSMLLNAYGWWKVSQITYIIALGAFGLGTVAALGSVYLFAFGRRPKGPAGWHSQRDTRPSPRPRPHSQHVTGNCCTRRQESRRPPDGAFQRRRPGVTG